MKKEKFIYEERYKYPIHNMLNVTDACNLACRYCFVEQHPHYMTLEIAKKAIDWTYQNYLKRQDKKLLYKGERPEINFFGGEPMLMYDKIIKPLVLYTEEKYNNLFWFGITTNCTLLTKESIDFLTEHEFGILCSIDGAEYTQCFNRPCRNGDNSSKLIEKNIRYLIEKNPNIQFRATGYEPTIKYLFDNFLYAESLGFRSFILGVNERNSWSKEGLQELQNQMNKIFLYTIQKDLNNEPHINNIPAFQIDKYVLGNKNNFKKDDCYRCGLGTTSCAIGWDGKIYGCQQEVSLDEKNIFLIGDLSEGIDYYKHTKLLKKYHKQIHNYGFNLKCKTCKIKGFCRSTSMNCCPSTNMYINKNTHKITDIRCFVTQLFYKELLLRNYILSSIKKEEDNNGM